MSFFDPFMDSISISRRSVMSCTVPTDAGAAVFIVVRFAFLMHVFERAVFEQQPVDYLVRLAVCTALRYAR
jgi:hypothetical protein